MTVETFPDWLANLENDDLVFIKNFILASGSLKEVARIYEVSYPTVRLRLDRLIEKIRVNDDGSYDPYVALIKTMAINEKIAPEAARKLIEEYRKLEKTP